MDRNVDKFCAWLNHQQPQKCVVWLHSPPGTDILHQCKSNDLNAVTPDLNEEKIAPFKLQLGCIHGFQ